MFIAYYRLSILYYPPDSKSFSGYRIQTFKLLTLDSNTLKVSNPCSNTSKVSNICPNFPNTSILGVQTSSNFVKLSQTL